MNAEDTARCQQAIHLANSGEKQQAYKRFCALYDQGNAENVTILYWIAYTTSMPEEAQECIEHIIRLEPNHPKLQELQNYASRLQQKTTIIDTIHPVMICPYCHHIGPSRIKKKISVGGWVWFLVFFLLFLCCLLAIVPTAQTSTMGCMAFFFFFLGIIGFFFKKRSYICGHCGIALGDIA